MSRQLRWRENVPEKGRAALVRTLRGWVSNGLRRPTNVRPQFLQQFVMHAGHNETVFFQRETASTLTPMERARLIA